MVSACDKMYPLYFEFDPINAKASPGRRETSRFGFPLNGIRIYAHFIDQLRGKSGPELRAVCWANSMSKSVLWPLWALEWPFWVDPGIWVYTLAPTCTLDLSDKHFFPRRWADEELSRQGPWMQMSVALMSVVLNTRHPPEFSFAPQLALIYGSRIGF